MTKILAIVNITYKEAVRKKAFLIIGLFAMVLIISSAFFPVISADSRVKLVEIWLIRGISVFAMIMAIFMAGASIPSEIEDRLVYSILVKPISKETFLLGKFIGFCVIIALFITAMGIIGLLYLYSVDFVTSSKLSRSSISYPRQSIKATQFSFRQPDKQPKAILEGNYLEREGLSITLKGRDLNEAKWHFESLNKNKLSDPVQIKLTAQIQEGRYRNSSDIGLIIYNPLEKKETRRRLTLFYEKPAIIEFPASYIDPLGGVQITIQRLKPNSQLTINPESLVILSAPRSFVWNFFKSSLLVYFQIVLIMGLLIGSSTILSAGVNIFLGIFLYFMGSTLGFFRESLVAMERTMKILMERSITTGAIPPGSDIMPYWLMQVSQFINNIVFKILPDLGKFNGTEYLLTSRSVPPDMISGTLSYLGIYLLIALLIGCIGFRTRDLQ